MSKSVKIIILVLILAVVAYYGYKWYNKRKAEAAAAAQPKKAVKVDTSSGKMVVSDISNGLNADVVAVV